MNAFEYFRPTTLKEALNLLQAYGEDAALLNGGTDLIVRMREGHVSPAYLVDIKHIPGLSDIIVQENRITIGACVLLNDLAAHPVIKSQFSFLAEAALTIGSKQVRNRATCIGNICNASPLADTATPLLSLNATIHIYGEEGVRTVPIKDFFVFVRQSVLKPNEIVTGISFATNENAKGTFRKISRRKEVDLSTVCATLVKSDNGFFLSLGAVAPTPIRLYKTEAFLNQAILDEKSIEEAVMIASGEVRPISDIRASEEYRREMVQVVVRSALTEWL